MTASSQNTNSPERGGALVNGGGAALASPATLPPANNKGSAMVFTNISMFHADLSAQEPIITHEAGWTDIRWSSRADCRGVITACTASNAEIQTRADGGEFFFDVIDEHMTWIQFHGRAGFKAAWALARIICRGDLLSGDIKSREEAKICGVTLARSDRREVVDVNMIIDASAHHIAEAA